MRSSLFVFPCEPTLICGDCSTTLQTMDAETVDCCITSPPYLGLRNYDCDGQIGVEATPAEYVDRLVQVFSEVHRVLKPDGTLWLNIGDGYARVGSNGAPGKSARVGNTRSGEQRRNCKPPPGFKNKDLFGMPWRLAFGLQEAGWYLRSDIIWNKTNGLPESVTDRPTKSHEYLFLLSKSEKYRYNAEAIREVDATGTGFRNKRSVWNVPTKPFAEAHFATMPPQLVELCILAGSDENDLILDPFGGAGTTGLVAQQLKRRSILIELNPEYVAIAKRRLGIGA